MTVARTRMVTVYAVKGDAWSKNYKIQDFLTLPDIGFSRKKGIKGVSEVLNWKLKRM